MTPHVVAVPWVFWLRRRLRWALTQEPAPSLLWSTAAVLFPSRSSAGPAANIALGLVLGLCSCVDPPAECAECAEGEGEGEHLPLDDDQVRLGTALVDLVGPAVAPAALPVVPAGVTVFDLGNLVVDVDGSTGSVLVDVDERVRGLTFIVYGLPGQQVMVTRVEDGAGDVVVDDAAVPASVPGFSQINALSNGFPAQFLSPGRVLPALEAGAFAVPSTPDVGLRAGTWSVHLGHFHLEVDDGGSPRVLPVPSAVRVLVLVRTAPVAPGRVGLALHFTGARGLSAAQAEEASSFQTALGLLQESWAAVGIDATDVEYADLRDGADFRTVVLDEPRCDGGDMDALVQKGVPDRLNLFFIDSFECGPFGPFLLGMSPGIPGVPFTTGTARSGVVIAGQFLGTDPEEFAITVAHESAHFLGLFHTQENDRFGDSNIYDNIADTPEAPASQANLMYFDVSRIGEPVLSVGQGQVMQQSPWVQR